MGTTLLREIPQLLGGRWGARLGLACPAGRNLLLSMSTGASDWPTYPMMTMPDQEDSTRSPGSIAADRRIDRRTSLSQAATILLRSGREVARGRTSNVSAKGAFVITRLSGHLPGIGGAVFVDLTVPAVDSRRGRCGKTRQVRRAGRIVRITRLGQLVGLGIEFV